MSDRPIGTPGKHWRIWLAVAVVFVCGLLVGTVATRAYHTYQRQHKWEQGLSGIKPRVMRHLIRELGLSEEQRREAERIVGRAELELLQLRMAQQPRVEEIVNRTADALKTSLTPEQRTKLDDLYGKLRKRWAADRAYIDRLQSASRP